MRHALLCLVIVIFALACMPEKARKGQTSALDTVDIPQTEVRDQGQVGFCWSYATIALVESDFKLRTGKSIDLSEEALGFYRLLHGLEKLAEVATSPDDPILKDSNRPHEGNTLFDRQWPYGSFELLKRYGVVPESVWSMKLTNGWDTADLKQKLRTGLQKRIAQKAKFGGSLPNQISTSELLSLMVDSGAFTSRPPAQFTLAGRSYTPQQYLKELGFDPDAFAIMETKSPEDLWPLIAATKRALARGVAVPFIYPVDFRRLKGDTFTDQQSSRIEPPYEFSLFSTHLVLITDFVNQGGRAGAIPADQAAVELKRPPNELETFLFKNSWGPIGSDDRYRIDLSYLIFSAAGSIEDSHLYYEGTQPERRGALRVFVPKDIANDPYGDEPINSRITLPAQGG
jgi:hypothetical protein